MEDEASGIWNWDRAFAVFPELLEAFLQVTLVATVVGSLIAAVVGLVVAMTRKLAPAWIAWPVHGFMEFIRMTPVVVQLLFAYYAFNFDPLATGIVVLGIHYAAYMAEVYRSGIDAVPKGQWEAATALSMSPGRTWLKVIIPQSLRTVVPALGTWVISMFKDTPFLMVIFITDMVRRAQVYGGQHYAYTEAITLAGLIFLAASYPTYLLMKQLEKRLARY
ncbi:ectoine/hydroxyectoine ABC transporter permease subunit EhuD [Bogoriella caseilytica]|uniref:Amino acid ABC transporter membrane protein 2 (PAAT family) n=1 Tax=Bogoriella caseilytica TaxID=56055 RepID=A0A3N2B9V0_9MICO|nr:ectoine/hydroxyectoine ABC transporter permease subunit EhuD [Bogoriella caseilytica]ROR72026.1 amino acid ABC transporter membrane protein 2 (PAAT family) [Bogoriella caseilytica]